MTRYEVASTVIAFFAFAAAVIGIALGYSANQRSHAANQLSHETQKTFLELERARETDRISDRGRAEVRARFIAAPKTGRFRDEGRALQFYNEGSGTARRIHIAVNGKPVSEDGRLTYSSVAFDRLGPRAEVNVLTTGGVAADPRFRLDITWEDDSRRPGVWESDLNG